MRCEGEPSGINQICRLQWDEGLGIRKVDDAPAADEPFECPMNAIAKPRIESRHPLENGAGTKYRAWPSV
jgi:hypothetical protein